MLESIYSNTAQPFLDSIYNFQHRRGEFRGRVSCSIQGKKRFLATRIFRGRKFILKPGVGGGGEERTKPKKIFFLKMLFHTLQNVSVFRTLLTN
jgi:hypothetical protein